jgi:hypothetical protein
MGQQTQTQAGRIHRVFQPVSDVLVDFVTAPG